MSPWETEMEDWEQKMRSDFDRYHEIRNTWPCADSVAAADEIATRWGNGSHREAWAYLEDATADFRFHPDTAGRLLDHVEQDRTRGLDTVTDVQYRSLTQAQEVTAPQTERRQVKGLGMQA